MRAYGVARVFYLLKLIFMKQFDLFGGELNTNNLNQYTLKVKAPIYEPKNKKPHILELYDATKTNRIINEIENSNLLLDEKKFLIEAAKRHTIFNYQKIADYYAHSNKEMQNLMERSALVIIDLQKAIEYGYMKLSEEVTQQYLKETYNEE